MRSPKDRLYRVLVIGATPAGIAATNKLGEIGVPVTLVDPDPDLNQKLSREDWRLSSGVPLNYAHRPGLLRILRNPRIRCVIPGSIRSLKHTPQGFCAHINSPAAFIDPDRCTLCGRCMEVCPADIGRWIKAHSIRRQAESSGPSRHRQAPSAPVPGQLSAGSQRAGICGPCQSREIPGSPGSDPPGQHPSRHLRQGLHASLRNRLPAGGTGSARCHPGYQALCCGLRDFSPAGCQTTRGSVQAATHCRHRIRSCGPCRRRGSGPPGISGDGFRKGSTGRRTAAIRPGTPPAAKRDPGPGNRFHSKTGR